MTDKYTFLESGVTARPGWRRYQIVGPTEVIGFIQCHPSNLKLIDNALNATSRAGSKSSQAKRDAAKRNIAKRWASKQKCEDCGTELHERDGHNCVNGEWV
jgi:hypothetical protein